MRDGGGNGGGGGRGGKGGGDLVGGGGGGEGFRGGGGLGGRGGGEEGGEGGGGILRGGGGGGDGGFGGGGGGGGNGSSLPLKTFISPGRGGVAAGLTPVSQPHTPPNQLGLGGGGGGSASAGERRASYLRRGIWHTSASALATAGCTGGCYWRSSARVGERAAARLSTALWVGNQRTPTATPKHTHL